MFSTLSLIIFQISVFKHVLCEQPCTCTKSAIEEKLMERLAGLEYKLILAETENEELRKKILMENTTPDIRSYVTCPLHDINSSRPYSVNQDEVDEHSPSVVFAVKRGFLAEKIQLRTFKTDMHRIMDEVRKSLAQIQKYTINEVLQLQTGVDKMTNDIRQLQNDLTSVSERLASIDSNHGNTVTSVKRLEEKVKHQIEEDEHCQSGSFTTKEFNTPLKFKFSQTFRNIPQVIVGTSVLDVAHNKNTRYNIKVSGVTTSGFTVHILVWADTLMYIHGFNWMACPK